VELGETVGCFGLFILFYVLFTKLFPIISIWEVREGRAHGVRGVAARVQSYLPAGTPEVTIESGAPVERHGSAAALPEPGSKAERVVTLLQYCLPLSFTVAMAGIIGWILSLIILARRLNDVPSASVGISIVAIPVFLTMLGVFWYVFLGIMRNREEQGQPLAEQQRLDPADEEGVAA
jgi:hypothetical protein